MDSQQVFLVPQVPQLPPGKVHHHHHHHQQHQTTTQMLQQPQIQQPQCSICGTTQKLLRCAKCKAIYYCSTDHQHLDWPTHKQECRGLAKHRHINNRVQQLTNGCGAININAHSNSSNSSSTNSPANGFTSYANPNNENEILNTKNQTTNQGSSTSLPFMGNIQTANSTTSDQMHNLLLPNDLNNDYGLNDSNQTFNDNNLAYYPNLSTSVDNNSLENSSFYQTDTNHYQPMETPSSLQQQILTQQTYHQQQICLPPIQPVLQFPVPQLSNHLINQREKSSSYQIGAAVVDDNLFENANERRYEELCRNIINDMNQYGLSVVDDFLGREKGLQILNEVHRMYSAGMFKDGQLVNNMKSEQDLRTIRGDKITWVKGVEQGCSNVGYLINQIDAVICRANSMLNNGKLGDYVIKERTKAMVACYPGSGSHYVMHVDNPNKDGRVITAIYYLNLNWDSRNSGGVLRIFPEQTKSVADIEPKFDRLIFFWSDKRNPHEVQPAHKTRYAITVWYFDANEREQALNRCKNTQNSNNKYNSASAAAHQQHHNHPNNINTTNQSSLATDTAATAANASTTTSKTPASSTLNPCSESSSLSVTSSSLLAANNDNSKNPAATNNSIPNPSKPIQVVRPNSYK